MTRSGTPGAATVATNTPTEALPVFRKVLIANRGEIALRILRACRALGVEAVVAYSEADRESLPVGLADEAICIGPADAKRSYLSAPAVISAAMVTGCDAIHPGYGFLSEDEGFAEVVAAHDITFIGPPANVLERFASKAGTRQLLGAYGLPTIPGSEGMLRDDLHALSEADRIGYPVLVKPSAGGGGKGMRMVRTGRELESVLGVCRSEAKAAFGDDSLYLEKWLDENRHVEVQVAVDRYGHGIHLGERDCSVQRRHQKILEEAPTPALSEAARADLAERAVRAVVAAGYENVGTLEFLVDKSGDFFFIEINCRIQVEHPVTEMITGVDLVATQMRIAAGEPLGHHPGRHRGPRPCHRVPDQRRGPGARLPARGRHRRALPRARWPGCPDGLAPVQRLRGAALLRLAARQAHRVGSGPGHRHRPRAGRARGAGHRRPRDQRRDPQGVAGLGDLPRRRDDDQPPRPGGQRRVPGGGRAGVTRVVRRDADLHTLPRRRPAVSARLTTT